MNKLTKKELRSMFWRSFALQGAFNYERMQNLGYCYSMLPAIKKLYNKKENQAKAIERHLEIFNTTTVVVPAILGITAAMEEENANNPEFDESSISAVKTALMGPLAGIGDSLIGGTLRVIATGIVAGLCMSGSLLGPILFLLIYNIPTILLRYFGVKFGYGLGNTLISKLSEGDLMKKLTMAMAIVGLMVIGAMVAMTVAVTTPIAFNINDTAFSLQETLDSIFPCLLPMAVTLGLYKLNKKHVSVLVQVIGIMVLGIVLGAIGILG